MKDVYFDQLETTDPIWVVYDKNYKDDNIFTNSNYITEYVLVQGKILKNELVQRTMDISDRYEEPIYNTYTENEIVVSIEGYQPYRRYYSDFYNKNGHMRLSPEYRVDAPSIYIFSTKELAKEYITEWCNMIIERLEKHKEESEICKMKQRNNLIS